MRITVNVENTNQTAESDSRVVRRPIGPVAYVVAVMSIIPVLGVILGPLALVWGLATLKRGGKPVAVIGAVGFGGQSLFIVFLIHNLVR
jgi:hypothetical protein